MLEEVAGWVGGVVMLVAYVMVSTRRTPSDGSVYQGMNVVGGILLTVSAVHAGAFPNVGLNVFWIAAGIVTIAWNLRGRVRAVEAAHRERAEDIERAERRAAERRVEQLLAGWTHAPSAARA